MQKTCIVVPCYNEGDRLPFTTISNFLKNSHHSIYFVNDGSVDNTLELLHVIQELHPAKVRIIDLNQNSGKAEAVRQGFMAAFLENSFDNVGYFDADLATPLEEVDYLLRYMEGEIRIVIGSRVQRLGAIVHRNPVRHYLGRIFATLASLSLDLKVYDSQCGAKIFRMDTAKVLFRQPFESKWLFDLELLYRFKDKTKENFNKEILEVPLRTWQEKGDSRISTWYFAKVPFELMRIKKHTLKHSK